MAELDKKTKDKLTIDQRIKNLELSISQAKQKVEFHQSELVVANQIILKCQGALEVLQDLKKDEQNGESSKKG